MVTGSRGRDNFSVFLHPFVPEYGGSLAGAGGGARAGRSRRSVLRAQSALSVSIAKPGKFRVSERWRSSAACAPSTPDLLPLLCALVSPNYWAYGLILWVNSHAGSWVGMSQKIPATFTAETGWPGAEDCALVTSVTLDEEWPVQLRCLPDVSSGNSAVSVGGGWAKFVADQSLGLGAFLTFENVDERRLVVTHHHRSAVGDCQPHQIPDVDSASVRDWHSREPPEADHSFASQSMVLPEDRIGVRPQFRKTLRKTHMKQQDSSRIVSATPNCWTIDRRFTHGSVGFVGHGVQERVSVEKQPCTSANLGGELLGVGAGCSSRVLAVSRSAFLRWRDVHPTRPHVAMLREDRNTYVWEADVLLIHEWLEAILCRERTKDRRHGGILEGRSAGVRGDEGVKGGGRWLGQQGTPGWSTWTVLF